MIYGDIRKLTLELAEIVAPPKNTLPVETVTENLRTAAGAWDAKLVPMMIEPLNLLASRRYQGIVFVGPARSGKSFTLVIGGIIYVVTTSPADTQITHYTQDSAREFSRKDLDRALRNSPNLRAKLSSKSRDDNVFDKTFTSGMILNMAWPTAGQHSFKTLKYIFLTDYDRAKNKDDVDGEGTLWSLGFKRIQNAMSRGKCLAESSPGGEYDPAGWVQAGPHEAPPTTGILGIYNNGTRAMLYWPCKHCGEFFKSEPGLASFNLPHFDELKSAVIKGDLQKMSQDLAKVWCTHCGGEHTMQDKFNLCQQSLWLHEGEAVTPDRKIYGERKESNIASYWQSGISAAYQTWNGLLLTYLQAVRTYALTSDEGPLKTTTNTDQAAPYLPRVLASRRSKDRFRDRLESWTRGLVPVGVRFITSSIDVQKHKFVVQVHGWGEHNESWLIDRFFITGSQRREGDSFAAIDPASYIEDWSILLEKVGTKQYLLESDSAQAMFSALVLFDCGGEDGVTNNAYEFWRKLRNANLGHRMMAVRGSSDQNAKRIDKRYPNVVDRKDRNSSARGDVPVFFLNSNLFKDTVMADLERDIPGPGFVHIPDWVDEQYFAELCAETRDAKGRWENKAKQPNEAFDLHCYARAACAIRGADSIDWRNPPPWVRTYPVASVDSTARPINPIASAGRRGIRSRGI